MTRKIETDGIACDFKQVDELTHYIHEFDLTRCKVTDLSSNRNRYATHESIND